MLSNQTLPTLIEVDEKKYILENACDAGDIETLRNFIGVLQSPVNDSYMKSLICLAYEKNLTTTFNFLLENCRTGFTLDLNLFAENANDSGPNLLVFSSTKMSINVKISKEKIQMGLNFVAALCERRVTLDLKVNNMNSLAIFIMLHCPRKVIDIQKAIRLLYTIETYTEFSYFNHMFQGRVPITIRKMFWHTFTHHFDFKVNFTNFPISKHMTRILQKEPKFYRIGVLLMHLYYIGHDENKPWKGDPMLRVERICQHEITHKDIYAIIAAIGNCVMLLKNVFIYDVFVYVVSILIYQRGMSIDFMPTVSIHHIFGTRSEAFIRHWLNNMKIWHSTLDPEECNKYKIVPFLHESSWRISLEDSWDRSCYSIDEFKEFYKLCREFKNGYPESYIFVCNILNFIITATNKLYDKITDECIDECLKLLPFLDLREALHNTLVPYYVQKLSKLVKIVTPPMLRRAYLECKTKYKVLSQIPLDIQNYTDIKQPYDYSNYYDDWLKFCKAQHHNIDLVPEKIHDFIAKLPPR